MAGAEYEAGAPPGWLARVGSWLLPEADRESVLGDLEERYRSLAATGIGRADAGRWYVVQVIVVAIGLRSARIGWGLRGRGRASKRGDRWIAVLGGDVRLAVRGLLREPVTAAVAVLTLAVGIGATSSIFSVVNPVLFQSLPYPDPARLVMVWEEESAGTTSNTGYATFADVERDSGTLESVAAMAYWTPTLTGAGDTEPLFGQSVTWRFFRTLGVRPVRGRDFDRGEDVPGANGVVILSHSFWQGRFGGDPTIIGRTITLSFRPYEVVGVLSADFESLLAPEAQLWRPLGYDMSLPWACRTCRHLRAVARIRPDRSLADAERELDRLSEVYVGAHPTEYEVAGMRLIPLREQLVQRARSALRVVLGAAGLVLLIACANVMNLLLARAVRRRPEFAVRAALGASRARVARQVLTESAVLGALGGGLGLLVAFWGVSALVGMSPRELPRLSAVRVDAYVLAFTALVAIGTSLVFGMLPALAAGRQDLVRGMEPGMRATGSRTFGFVRNGIVVTEVALALALAVGAGLLVRSLDRLLAVDTGFEPAGVLALDVSATGPAYDEDESVWTMQSRLVAAVAAVPGVERAAISSQIPLGGNFDRWGVTIEDKPLANPASAPGADRYSVSSGYLATMGVGLVRGRGFTEADRAGAAPVVLINRAFAQGSWPGEQPIGERVRLGGPDTPWRTIVGIVDDVRHHGLDIGTSPQIYMPAAQSPRADPQFVLVVRTPGDPARLADAVRAVVRSVDPNLAIGRVAPASELVRGSTIRRQFAFRIFGAFAAVALLLACAGIYGVLSASVATRTREIGVRAALGATRARVLRLIVGQGMRLVGIGVLVGVALALALTRLIRDLLFDIEPDDPVTLIGVCTILALVSFIACAGPAWRAARTDPVRTLRGD